jgi:hypothetical protein
MSAPNDEVPVTGVVPLAQMKGDTEEDTRLLWAMASGAADYLRSFPWFEKIRSAYFGDGVGGIVGVFLFHVEPSTSEMDEWLWVVFGDISPALLPIDRSKKPSQALEFYVSEMSKWVELAKQGRSSTKIIPVLLAATPENAAAVESKLKVLQELIVPAFREAEAVRA